MYMFGVIFPYTRKPDTPQPYKIDMMICNCCRTQLTARRAFFGVFYLKRVLGIPATAIKKQQGSGNNLKLNIPGKEEYPVR